MVAGMLNRLANYEGGVQPNVAQEGTEEQGTEPKKEKKKVGVMT